MVSLLKMLIAWQLSLVCPVRRLPWYDSNHSRYGCKSKPAKANPRKLIEAITDNGATSMFGSPALVDTLSRYGAENGIKLPSLKTVISCGAPARNDILQRFFTVCSMTSAKYLPLWRH